MSDIRTRIVEVMSQAQVMSLATVDDSGPWAAIVGFLHDENLHLYWKSDREVRHSRALERDPRAAASILACNDVHKELAIQVAGTVAKIDSLRPDLNLLYLSKKRRLPSASETLKAIETGRSWYVLKPDFIDLIDEENFGFEKQKLVLNN